MFERNRVDNAPDVTAIPVEATLVDGTVIKGRLLVPAGKSLADVLGSPGAFVEMEPYGGERSFLAKAQLALVRPVGVPKAPNLAARLADPGGFDPHRVLGLSAGAGRDEVRQAYFARAKAYHPDRYATAELPEEVRDYLAAMARRINAAYAALTAPEKREAARQEPVFTSAGR
jgi:hypothetical protein